MSTDLNDADIPLWVRDFPGGIRIYRAGELNGLAAGRARAIEEAMQACANLDDYLFVSAKDGNWKEVSADYASGWRSACRSIIVRVSALNARSASADG